MNAVTASTLILSLLDDEEKLYFLVGCELFAHIDGMREFIDLNRKAALDRINAPQTLDDLI